MRVGIREICAKRVGLDGGDGVGYKRGGVGEGSKIGVSEVAPRSPASEVVAAGTWFVA